MRFVVLEVNVFTVLTTSVRQIRYKATLIAARSGNAPAARFPSAQVGGATAAESARGGRCNRTLASAVTCEGMLNAER